VINNGSKRRQARSRDSSVGITNGYRLDDRGFRVRVPVGSRIFHVVQTGSGIHPTTYPMGTVGSFPGGKAAGVWSLPLTSNKCRGQENMDLYIHSPIHLHGVLLKHRDNFTLMRRDAVGIVATHTSGEDCVFILPWLYVVSVSAAGPGITREQKENVYVHSYSFYSGIHANGRLWFVQ
jgi:hypothetical protein